LESDIPLPAPQRPPLSPEVAPNRPRIGLGLCPRPQLDPPAEGDIPAPPGGEPARVLLQQRRGVDPVAPKRPAAAMVHEDVPGHGQGEAGAARPLSQVIVIAEPPPRPARPARRSHRTPPA